MVATFPHFGKFCEMLRNIRLEVLAATIFDTFYCASHRYGPSAWICIFNCSGTTALAYIQRSRRLDFSTLRHNISCVHHGRALGGGGLIALDGDDYNDLYYFSCHHARFPPLRSYHKRGFSYSLLRSNCLRLAGCVREGYHFVVF